MDLSGITLSQLRAIAAVDQHRSFREAAAHCHVTQPALSMQIRKIEDILDVRIFDRSRQPIMPTGAGARVLAQARAVLRECERIGQVVSDSQGRLGGSYRLGVIPTIASTLLPLFLPTFTRRYPGVELLIEELQTETMLDRLRADTLDGGIAATPLRAKGIHEAPLYREPLLVYLPPDHPLAARKRVPQHELVQHSVWILAEGHCLGDQVLHLCKAHRPLDVPDRMRVQFRSGSLETLVGLVDAGCGLTVLPQLLSDRLPAATRKARLRPFSGPPPVREISLIYAREDLRRPTTEALLAVIEESLPAKLPGPRGKAVVLPPRSP